jgi:hypothetical protein
LICGTKETFRIVLKETGREDYADYFNNENEYLHNMSMAQTFVYYRNNIKPYADKGYDGVLSYEEDIRGSSAYNGFIAFRPEQIKSATDNADAFDAGYKKIKTKTLEK